MLCDELRVIIYNCHMFIIQATGANPIKNFTAVIYGLWGFSDTTTESTIQTSRLGLAYPLVRYHAQNLVDNTEKMLSTRASQALGPSL